MGANERLSDWLEISTEGFAQRQVDRPPAHLVKEVIQNALDATEGMTGGEIRVRIERLHGRGAKGIEVTVANNGPPVKDFRDLRTVFCSGKEDSFTLRGRMGQGFKEILCLATEAWCHTGEWTVHWHRDEGQRVTDISPRRHDTLFENKLVGPSWTQFILHLPWDRKVIPDILTYLRTILPPEGRLLVVNGQPNSARLAESRFTLRLTTEVFEKDRWARREREGVVEFIPRHSQGSDQPGMIFEMGLPIQPLDWRLDYHLNVLMRVPMNPRRDAVAAGYLPALYAQLVPLLLPTLSPEALKDEWVSLAMDRLSEEDQKAVLTKTLGVKAVRSVPTMGGHDFDSDARELGFAPVDTSLLPAGMRGAARAHLRSSREVEVERQEAVEQARGEAVPTAREELARDCLEWLASQVLGTPVKAKIVPTLIIHGDEVAAAWARGANLLLNKKFTKRWRDALSPEALGLLAHETAHHKAPHHGDDFRRAVEEVAGGLARLCLDEAKEIDSRFGGLREGRRLSS